MIKPPERDEIDEELDGVKSWLLPLLFVVAVIFISWLILITVTLIEITNLNLW